MALTESDLRSRLRESIHEAARRPETVRAGYRWDAFVSYHRDRDFDGWMTKVVGILKRGLANSLGGKASVFFDVGDIALGDRWSDELKAALGTSRCLIPFIEPAYFASPWCCAEFETFRARKAPITPIAVYTGDAKWIPQEARAYQYADVEEYHLGTLAFGTDPRASNLEALLNKHASAIGRMVQKAPAFRKDFPVVMPVEKAPRKAPRRGRPRARRVSRQKAPQIFLNVPFSEAYRPVFDAIMFAILSFGFVPRTILEGAVAQPRMERILKLIEECPLALHDLSESRMNSALELGMFLAAGRFGGKKKEYLLVVREPYEQHKLVSDLAGMDFAAHHMEPQTAMLVVANWLATRPQTVKPVPGSAALWSQYRRFRADLPQVVRAAAGKRGQPMGYADTVFMIREWLRASGMRAGR